MISPIKSIRQRIREQNKYVPKRKAKRGYVPGTRQTIKLPGDKIIDEKGNTHIVQ